MKKTKRFLAVVLCMLLMLTPLAVVAETVTVQAAGPQTVKVKLDKKTGKRYGYDENNQKVTQQWGVTAKGFRYYFGKNGAAYQPDADFENCDTLIDDGILDSFAILSIVSELQDTYDITITPADIIPENFNSAKALWDMVCRLKG